MTSMPSLLLYKREIIQKTLKKMFSLPSFFSSLPPFFLLKNICFRPRIALDLHNSKDKYENNPLLQRAHSLIGKTYK